MRVCTVLEYIGDCIQIKLNCNLGPRDRFLGLDCCRRRCGKGTRRPAPASDCRTPLS